jgi:transcriptional regulator with XRE-family HTH domain
MSSDTIEAFPEFGGYGPLMELNARIHKARTEANMTQYQLAAATGKTRGAVAQWESGEVRPRHSTMKLIATATGKALEWLESGIDAANVGLVVVGEVAAGTWKEGGARFKPIGMPVAPDPRYPKAAQRLYRVVGNSVNKLVGDGEYVHCVDILAANLTPEAGDLVIVRRMEHGLAEYTAKRMIRHGKKWILRPESTDPEWQSDIILDGDEGIEVQVTDLVIAKWFPIERGRL